jgi:mannonate dehydratase
MPTYRNGYAYANEAPGWGIEVNEAAAKKYPFGGQQVTRSGQPSRRESLNGGWGVIRRRDGTVIKQ